MWCPWCRQLADGSQASGAAGPGILATVLCVSQNDFVRGEGGRGGSHFPFMYRSPFIFTKGWVDLKYIVTVTECCVIPGEGLTLPGVFWAGFTKKAFDPAPSRQRGSSQPIVIPSQSVPILDRFLNIGKVFLSSAVDVPLRWVHGCEPLPGLPRWLTPTHGHLRVPAVLVGLLLPRNLANGLAPHEFQPPLGFVLTRLVRNTRLGRLSRGPRALLCTCRVCPRQRYTRVLSAVGCSFIVKFSNIKFRRMIQ